MPLFKQGKYELGMAYIDQAVKYNAREWQEYRAFIKCIFAHTYKEAITDFEDCKAKFGNGYIMDHAYDFYIALSKLQLNEFAEAEALLLKITEQQLKELGEDWVNHVDLFYLGIAQYEQSKYEEAVVTFEKTLKLYDKFAEAIHYKGLSHQKLGNEAEAAQLLATAKQYGQQGYSITEINANYERYPYQMPSMYWQD